MGHKLRKNVLYNESVGCKWLFLDAVIFFCALHSAAFLSGEMQQNTPHRILPRRMSLRLVACLRGPYRCEKHFRSIGIIAAYSATLSVFRFLLNHITASIHIRLSLFLSHLIIFLRYCELMGLLQENVKETKEDKKREGNYSDNSSHY